MLVQWSTRNSSRPVVKWGPRRGELTQLAEAASHTYTCAAPTASARAPARRRASACRAELPAPLKCIAFGVAHARPARARPCRRCSTRAPAPLCVNQAGRDVRAARQHCGVDRPRWAERSGARKARARTAARAILGLAHVCWAKTLRTRASPWLMYTPNRPRPRGQADRPGARPQVLLQVWGRGEISDQIRSLQIGRIRSRHAIDPMVTCFGRGGGHVLPASKSPDAPQGFAAAPRRARVPAGLGLLPGVQVQGGAAGGPRHDREVPSNRRPRPGRAGRVT